MNEFLSSKTAIMLVLCAAFFILLAYAGDTMALAWVVVAAIWTCVAHVNHMNYEELKEKTDNRIMALTTERNHYLALYRKYHDLYINCTDDAAEDKE